MATAEALAPQAMMIGECPLKPHGTVSDEGGSTSSP